MALAQTVGRAALRAGAARGGGARGAAGGGGGGRGAWGGEVPGTPGAPGPPGGGATPEELEAALPVSRALGAMGLGAFGALGLAGLGAYGAWQMALLMAKAGGRPVPAAPAEEAPHPPA